MVSHMWRLVNRRFCLKYQAAWLTCQVGGGPLSPEAGVTVACSVTAVNVDGLGPGTLRTRSLGAHLGASTWGLGVTRGGRGGSWAHHGLQSLDLTLVQRLALQTHSMLGSARKYSNSEVKSWFNNFTLVQWRHCFTSKATLIIIIKKMCLLSAIF